MKFYFDKKYKNYIDDNFKKMYKNIYGNKHIIIKIYKNKKHAKTEIKNLNTLKLVKNVPKLIGFIYDEISVVMMTRIKGVDLYQFSLKHDFTETEIISIYKQIFKIYDNCVLFNIHHPDIKPENIIYDNGKISLIDFETKHTKIYGLDENGKYRGMLWCVAQSLYTIFQKKKWSDSKQEFPVKCSEDFKNFIISILYFKLPEKTVLKTSRWLLN